MHKTILFAMCLFALPLVSCSQQPSGVHKLEAAEFNQQMKQGNDVQLVDVRTPQEYAEGHLEGAQNIDFRDPQFEAKIAALDKHKKTFVYCLGGGRSAAAAGQMASSGFTDVYDMKGGILSWKNGHLPVTAATAPVAADGTTVADFNQLIAAHPVVLIDFYAPWCGPCKMMEPSLSRLTEKYKGKVFVQRINIDEAKDLGGKLGITAIPLFHLYRNGKLVKAATGYMQEEKLEALINTQ